MKDHIDWSIFNGFSRPAEERSWKGVVAWTDAIDARLGPKREKITHLRTSSDMTFKQLGGDPSARDWTSFRPLRRHREEDWSDWLAQLIEDSTTGRFAWSLLGAFEGRTAPADYINPIVRRELPHEGYRADLVIEWRDATYTHIEVKVGDPNLAKTLVTAQKVESLLTGSFHRRSDAVLLLPGQCEAWAIECSRQRGMRERVHELTWLRVARSLREALLYESDEPISWRVWAHAFCGAIEQRLLGLQFRPTSGEWVRSLTPHGLDTAATLLTVRRESDG